MKVKNKRRGTIWIKGIQIRPGETADIPKLTKPEVLMTGLRTKLEIVTEERRRPSRRSVVKNKSAPVVEEEKPVEEVKEASEEVNPLLLLDAEIET
jgi:hypothetical protein